jgi:hypothetical protein
MNLENDLYLYEFLSEDDLELQNMSDEELYATWNHWLKLAQASNELDKDKYSHGVFIEED